MLTFTVTDEQEKKVKKWAKKIKKDTKKEDNTYYSDDPVYSFEQTGIAPIIRVYYLGYSLDITDVETW